MVAVIEEKARHASARPGADAIAANAAMLQQSPTTSEGPRPRYPASTVRQLLGESANEHAERAAIVSPGRRPLTYRGLGERVDAVARALAEAGLGRGRRVAVALPHGPEFAVALLAACCATTCAPLNDQLTEAALAQLLAAMRIDALMAVEGADTNATRAARRLTLPILGVRVMPDSPAGSFDLLARAAGGSVDVKPPQLDDIALVTHTSGTTGLPKIMPFEHWRMAESARSRVELASILSTDRCLAVVPFHSTVAIRRGLLPALLVGASVICPPVLDAATLAALVQSMRPTQLLAPPVVLIAMMDELERRQPRPAHCLRFVTSAFAELAPAVRQRIEHAFGVPVVESYGMAECGSIAETPLPPAVAPPGSVGRPCTLEVAVADDSGRFLGHDRPGEIVVRGAEVIAGYENSAEASRSAFREGWFRTGDVGRVDRDGFVFLDGRIKDMINRGGSKVLPGEVEQALGQHAAVSEAAAFAVPHPTLGEDVFAAVVSADPRLTEGELRRFVRPRLAADRRPTRILVLDELPRATLGKVNRVELARIAQRMAAADLEPPRPGTEAAIASVFAEVLEVPAVSRASDFFHLGGDSLRAVRLVMAIEAACGARLDLESVFDHPTVAELAECVAAAVPVAAGGEPARTAEQSFLTSKTETS